MIKDKMVGCYLDGTPFTEPFWLISCTSCGNQVLSTQKKEICSKCGERATYKPANQEKRKPV